MEARVQENKGVWPHKGVLTDNTDLGGRHCLLQMDNYNELQETITISTRKTPCFTGCKPFFSCASGSFLQNSDSFLMSVPLSFTLLTVHLLRGRDYQLRLVAFFFFPYQIGSSTKPEPGLTEPDF